MCIALNVFIILFNSQFYLPLCYQFLLALVVVGGLFMIQKSAWMFTFESFQTILPILIQWMMP